jgi:hypothetical protein
LTACSSDGGGKGTPGAGGAGGAGGISASSGGAPAAASGGSIGNGGTGGGTASGGASPTSGGAPGGGGTAHSGGAPEATGGTNAGSSGGAPAATGGATGTSDAGTPGSALTDDQLLVPDPSWTCNMPAGIPPTKGGKLVFDVEYQVGDVHDFGKTQYGRRQLVEIAGGKVTGPKIKGAAVSRGLDLTLTLSSGALEVEQVNVLQASDGALVYFRTCGAAPSPGNDVRVVADFEAPNGGPYAFLNTGTYVGVRTYDAAKRTLHVGIYDMAGVAPPTASVQLSDPPGERQQSWDCKKAPGSRTTTVYMESVGIGSSLAVGASKRGTRNVIPITGGTTSGRVKGTVLSSGADYQLLGSAFELDARYTLHTDDDVLVLVRNCGPVGALVPTFETREDGPYAWLNEDRWVSSDPGLAPGTVNLTIYDTR